MSSGHRSRLRPIFPSKRLKIRQNCAKSRKLKSISRAAACHGDRAWKILENRVTVQRDVSTLGPIGSNEAAAFRLLNAVNRRGRGPDNRAWLGARASTSNIYGARCSREPFLSSLFAIQLCARRFRSSARFAGAARNSRSGRVHPHPPPPRAIEQLDLALRSH